MSIISLLVFPLHIPADSSLPLIAFVTDSHPVDLNAPTEPAAELPALQPLPQLAKGALAQIVEVATNSDDANRLKALGICIGRSVQLLQAGDPLIVRVLGSRVGIASRLAESVIVRTTCKSQVAGSAK